MACTYCRTVIVFAQFTFVTDEVRVFLLLVIFVNNTLKKITSNFHHFFKFTHFIYPTIYYFSVCC